MKKLFLLLSIFALSVTLFACANQDDDVEWKIVMLTDVGTITDKSFNQGTWEGVKDFAEANDIEAWYYRPNTGTTADYEEAIDLNVAHGANIVVTPGFLFETAIYNAQTKYPDVYFILIDGEPHTADYGTYNTASNTTNILFQEEQSGFLAGYAAVADGFTELGFMGGMEVPAVQKFGIGYVAGAFYAANELSKTINFSADRYTYLGDFDNKPEHTTTATSWFTAGTEVIFAAAGGAGNAVMAAAESFDPAKTVIGVDVDQSNESETVISSAMKQLAVAVDIVLNDLVNNDSWAGGTTVVKGASEEAVGLPTGDSWGWTTFTETEYEAVYALVEAGTIVVPTSEADLATFLAANGNPSVADLIAKTES